MTHRQLLYALSLALAATLAWTTLGANAAPPPARSLAGEMQLGETVLLTAEAGDDAARTVTIHYLVLLEGSTAKHNSQSMDVVIPKSEAADGRPGVLLNTSNPRFLMADIPAGVHVR